MGPAVHVTPPHPCRSPTSPLPSYDKRDGTGKMAFKSGLRYEGEWKEDKAHGCGRRGAVQRLW